MGQSVSIFETPVEGERVARVLEQVMECVNRVGGQTVTRPTPNTLVISRKSTGCLILLVCVVLFPIGLLALLARKNEVLTITVEEQDGKLVASAVGEADPKIASWVEAFLRRGQLGEPARAQHTDVKKTCPSCNGQVPCGAAICPHCSHELEPWTLNDGAWWVKRPDGWYWLNTVENRWDQLRPQSEPS